MKQRAMIVCLRWIVALISIVTVSAQQRPALGARTPDAAVRLEHVRTLFGKLYFSEARRACQQSLRQGGNTRRQLLELYRLEGLIASATGDGAGAMEAFKRLLVLGGEVELDSQAPPRTRQAFARAQRWITSQPQLALKTLSARSSADKLTMQFETKVLSDPLKMVASAVLTLKVANGHHRFVARGTKELRWSLPLALLAVARGQTLPYSIQVRDAAANELMTMQAKLAVPTLDTTSGGHAIPDGTSATSQPRRLWTWIAATASVAALGLGIGLRVSAGSTNHEWQRDPVALGRSQHDWEQLRDSGQAAEAGAYASFGVAAALALTSAALYWFEGHRSESNSSSKTSAKATLPTTMVPF